MRPGHAGKTVTGPLADVAERSQALEHLLGNLGDLAHQGAVGQRVPEVGDHHCPEYYGV